MRMLVLGRMVGKDDDGKTISGLSDLFETAKHLGLRAVYNSHCGESRAFYTFQT